MAKNALEKTEYIEVSQNTAETLSVEELDIIAAFTLNGSDEVVHINQELNDIGIDDTINIKDYVNQKYGLPVRNIINNLSTEFYGIINVTYGYSDVAHAIMSKKFNLQINIGEDCIRFRDLEVVRVLAANYPQIFVGGVVRKSAASSIGFAVTATNTQSIFSGVEYFNEAYYFASFNSRNFMNNIKVKEISIPKNTKTIAYQLCQDASNLEYVHNFEDNPNITSFGGQCFWNCSKLKLKKLPPNITSVSTYTFEGCSEITLSELPEKIVQIDTRAFYGCSKITIKKIPDLVQSLAAAVFYGCTSMTEIDLNNITTITSNQTFGNCTNLKKAYIYKLKTFTGGSWVFNTQDIELHVNDLLSFINISKSYRLTNARFHLFDKSGNKITVANISGITTIPSHCFAYWSCPATMDFPDAENIEVSAFSNCTNLVALNTMPIKYIGDNAFYNCTNLVNLDLSEVEHIGLRGLQSCSKLDMTNMRFDKIRTIGDYGLQDVSFIGVKRIILRGDISIGTYGMIGANSIPTTNVIDYLIILDNTEKSPTLNADVFITLRIINVVDLSSNVKVLEARMFQSTTIRNLVLRSNTVVVNNTGFNINITKIFVDENLVNQYKSNTGWSSKASAIYPIRGTEWLNTFGATSEFADYPSDYSPKDLESIEVEYEVLTKHLWVTYNNASVVESDKKGYNLSVISPVGRGVSIGSDNVLSYGNYNGSITIGVTSTYNPSISNSITFTV